MRTIFGIGNPGLRYRKNRHNVGFMVVDYFADSLSFSFSPSKYNFYYSKGKIDHSPFLLIIPTTYVNNSGIAAIEATNKFNIDLNDFLVVVDDVNLETGKIRIRNSGSDSGHNGINSIIYQLNSDQFPRIRIGIGSNFEKGEMASYVLSDFSDDELQQMRKSFDDCKLLITEFVKGGYQAMIDFYSRLSNQSSNNNFVNT